MRTQVFSPTYPTWALVGGTSRPAGETVYDAGIINIGTNAIISNVVSNKMGSDFKHLI